MGPYRCEFLVKLRFYPFTLDPPPPSTPSPLFVEEKKTGIKTGFAGLAKSLAYCVQKRSSLGFDARGSPRRKSKADWTFESKDFMKKREFVETRKNGVKSC